MNGSLVTGANTLAVVPMTISLHCVVGSYRSNLGTQSDMWRFGCRVHEMEQFEGDVARVRVDSRKPAQTMTTHQLLKLEL